MLTKLRTDAFISFIDQALISVTNFLVGLYFVHFAAKDAYGWYTIGFGVILLVVGLGNALITTPMTVNFADRDSEQTDVYCTSMLMGQWLAILPIVCLFIIASVWVWATNLVEDKWLYFYFVVGMASLGALLREFFRRYHYLRLKATKVVALDLLFSICLLSFLCGIHFLYTPHIHLWAIGAYGMASGLAGGAGLILARFHKLVSWREIRANLIEAWQQGRWALGGVMVTWVQGQSHNYLLALLAGAASVAEANAARLFLAPVSLVNTSLNNVLLPRLVTLRANGQTRHAIREARKILVILLAGICIYVILMYRFKDVLFEWVLSRQYAKVGPFVMAWAAVILFQTARTNSSILLQTFRRFRDIAVANALSAALVVVASLYLINKFSVLGGITAQAFGEFLLVIFLWVALSRVRK